MIQKERTLTPTQFAFDMRSIGKEWPGQESLELQKTIFMTAARGVIMKTPTATGEARGGWVPYVNTVRADLQKTFDISGAPTIARAQRFVERRRIPFKTWWIGNSVEHIVPLEFGSDTIAPQAMVRLTLQELAVKFT